MLVAQPTASASGGESSSSCYWVFPLTSWTPTANITIGGSDPNANYLIVAVQNNALKMYARYSFTYKSPLTATTFKRTIASGVIPSGCLPIHLREQLSAKNTGYVQISNEWSGSRGIKSISIKIDHSGTITMQLQTNASGGTSGDDGIEEFGDNMWKATSGTRMN